MISEWLTSRRIAEVSCTVDLEQTTESLHAYVELHGIEIGPGDEVVVHDPPGMVGFGERLVCDRRATVVRAGPWRNLAARVAGYLELTELYEVSFSNGRAK
ncbi:MAG: hypothetical protein AB7S93_23220 [Xanthobacteraceae bacterium]